MKLTGDEQHVQAQIDEWTVEVMRDMQAALARGPGSVFRVGDDMFEIAEGGEVRPVTGKGRRRPSRRADCR